MASLLTEMPTVLDQREIWFTHLLLLGFDPLASEEKFSTPFSRDMFAHINKKGMEVVVHFLFSRLNSQLAYEEFRDCWPVYEKKQEQQFRRACANWLTRIAKDEPESKLPRSSGSLLLSPGGDKFYQFLLRFSSYVLKTVCLRDVKSEEKQVFLPSFLSSASPFPPAQRKVCLSALRALVSRQGRQVRERLELVAALHQEWRDCTNKLTADYRSCSKRRRELSKRLASLQEEHKKRVVDGTPMRQLSSASGDRVHSLSAEVTTAKRKSRIQKVRDMWKLVENFDAKSTHQREVVDSIMEGNANKHSVNAKDIVFQIPDMILQEYEALIRQGKVGNTYEAGKLNLISLIQVWNCCLQVLRDRILEGEVPSFDSEAQYVSGELQAHRAHLAAAQSLRATLVEFRGSLEKNISQLEARLEGVRGPPGDRGAMGVLQQLHKEGGSSGVTAPLLQIPPITVPSLELDLLPPSPEKSLAASPPAEQSHLTHLSFPRESVSTPEAVQNISRSVHRAKEKHLKTRPSKIPTVAAPATTSLASDMTDPSIFQDSPGNITEASSKGATHRGRVSSRSVTQSQGKPSKAATPNETGNRAVLTSRGRPVKPTLHATSMLTKSATRKPHVAAVNGSSSNVRPTAASQTSGVSLPSSSKAAFNKPSTLSESYVSRTKHSRKLKKPVTPSANGLDAAATHPQQTPSRPKAPSSATATTPLLESMPRAHELLADQIAAAVASHSEGSGEFLSPHTPEREAQLHSLMDPISAMGVDAFVSKDKIARTPISKPIRTKRMESKLSPLLQSPAVQRQLMEEDEPSSTKTLITGPPAPRPEVASPPIGSRRAEDGLTILSTQSPLLRTPATTAKLAPSPSQQPGYKSKPTPPLMGTAILPPITEAGVTSSPPPPEPQLRGSDYSPHRSPLPPTSISGSGSPDTSSEHRLRGSVRQKSDSKTIDAGPLHHQTSSPQPVSTPMAASRVSQSLPTPASLSSQQIGREPLNLSTPEITAPGLHFSQSQLTPKVVTALPSARKVAFEHTPDAVARTYTYTTPTQSPSLFETAQPPTPFQHANFDLDSSGEDFLGSSSSSREKEDFESGSSAAEAEESATPKWQMAADPSPQLAQLPPREHFGQSPMLPGVIATGNLLNFGDPVAAPLVPALTETAGIVTEAQLINIETPVRSVESTVHKDASGKDLMELSSSSQDALLRLLPSQGSEGRESASMFSGFGAQTTPQELSDMMWLAGAGGSGGPGAFDGSPFLVSPSPHHSLSLTSNSEELLEHSSGQG